MSNQQRFWTLITFSFYWALNLWFIWLAAVLVSIPAWIGAPLWFLLAGVDFFVIRYSLTYAGGDPRVTKKLVLDLWFYCQMISWLLICGFTLAYLPARIFTALAALFVWGILRWAAAYNLVNWE